MQQFKNKTTVFIIVALVIVCGGSFLGVRALNRSAHSQPVGSTYSSTSTTASTTTSTTLVTTSPVISPTLPAGTTTTGTGTTLPSQGTITTYPVATTTTTKPATTTTTTTTTTVPTTPSTSNPYTGAPQSTDENINNAAIFDEGFLSYLYNPNGNFYYTNSDPWQRALGFNSVYDMAAPFVVMYYDTLRCRFEYGNKDWMIQLWKGQYGWVFIGHEIGVYTKPKERETMHYDCASNEEALYMSMTGYRDGEALYSREYGKYWWCTGFVPGKLDKFSDRSELQIKCRITAKDYKMLLGICGGLKENGLQMGKDFTTNGLDVFLTW